jgi:hypothetical protein
MIHQTYFNLNHFLIKKQMLNMEFFSLKNHLKNKNVHYNLLDLSITRSLYFIKYTFGTL